MQKVFFCLILMLCSINISGNFNRRALMDKEVDCFLIILPFPCSGKTLVHFLYAAYFLDTTYGELKESVCSAKKYLFEILGHTVKLLLFDTSFKPLVKHSFATFKTRISESNQYYLDFRKKIFIISCNFCYS
ncbi:hypothetical protein HCUR_00454 [Holospora curviuscula]|uniref:Uncharacterized protein n=1 Tax=Holospora curviuscula TaxID=1082868 RepID=A0A2S5RAD6_9PROT|nr:hypothetical protein HCUR_00454 [Holospora curviuscula]